MPVQAKTLGAENYIISEFVCRLGDEIEIDQCMVNSPNKDSRTFSGVISCHAGMFKCRRFERILINV